jgi:hypothetical protein
MPATVCPVGRPLSSLTPGLPPGVSLKKPRRVNGQPLRTYRRHPYGAETGRLSGGLKVLVVSYGAKSYATHRLTRPAAEGRRRFQLRAQRQEVIRVCQDQRGLTGCQARSKRAPRPHISCCGLAFGVLAREKPARGISLYQRKRRLSCQGRSVTRPALERLKRAA